MYSRIMTNAWNVHKENLLWNHVTVAVKWIAVGQKTNDKDKFQFRISEYKCNAPF